MRCSLVTFLELAEITTTITSSRVTTAEAKIQVQTSAVAMPILKICSSGLTSATHPHSLESPRLKGATRVCKFAFLTIFSNYARIGPTRAISHPHKLPDDFHDLKPGNGH